MKTNHSKSPCTHQRCGGELPEIYCSKETLSHKHIPHFIRLIETLDTPLMCYLIKPVRMSSADDDSFADLYVFVDPGIHPYDPKDLVDCAAHLGNESSTLGAVLNYLNGEQRKAEFQQTCREVNCPYCSRKTHPYQQWALKGSDFFGKVVHFGDSMK